MSRQHGESTLALFEHFKTFVEMNGYSPTIRELGQCAGIEAPSQVKYHLDALVTGGELVRSKVGTARSYHLAAALPNMPHLQAARLLLGILHKVNHEPSALLLRDELVRTLPDAHRRVYRLLSDAGVSCRRSFLLQYGGHRADEVTQAVKDLVYLGLVNGGIDSPEASIGYYAVEISELMGVRA